MESAGQLLVKIEKDFSDEIKLSDGGKLYLDSSYNRFENRMVSGVLTSVPPKFQHVFQAGDTVYFHHSLVIDDRVRRCVDWKERIFILQYTPDHTFNCLVYLIKRGDKMFTVNDFVFIRPIEEEKYRMIGSLYVPDSAASEKVWRGEIAYSNDYVNESMGVCVGDTVVITDRGRYEMNIMGESLWRMRSDRNILAICEEVQP